jgi:hypothetical protein
MAMCNEYPPPGMGGGRGLEGLPLLIDSMGLPVVTYRLAGSLPPVAVHGVAMRLQPITVQPTHRADRILGGFPPTDTPPISAASRRGFLTFLQVSMGSGQKLL